MSQRHPVIDKTTIHSSGLRLGELTHAGLTDRVNGVH